MSEALDRLAEEITRCRLCPRLVAWREQVAREKRRAYAAEAYWGKPVPGFGDSGARVLLLGLAPGAHGSNRTGRMFTGDASGDFLYPALHRAGFSSRPLARSRDDGLRLRGTFITAACRCAPPQNRPAPEEVRACAPFLDRELELLGQVRVILCLGGLAWEVALGALARRGIEVPRPRPRFAHGAELRLPGAPTLLGSYHPSRQNTNTGRLTAPMLDAVLRRARQLGGGPRTG